MRKRILSGIGIAGLACICLMGCESKGELALEGGILSWSGEENAIHYEISISDVSSTVTGASLDLSKQCKFEGEHTVTVAAQTQSGQRKEVGTMEISAKKLDKPAIYVETGSDGEKCFVWAADKGVHKYTYDLHDGAGDVEVTAGADGKCTVAFDGSNRTTITVKADGSSDGNTVYLDNEATFEYEGSKIFNLAELGKYPFYYTSKGKGGLENFSVGTTLEKGAYDLEFDLYFMDSNGNTLSGNGLWGRRITDTMKDVWCCNTDVSGWPGSGNTIPDSDQKVTYTLSVNVNKYGEASLSMGDFKANEMMVVADVRYNGKSVMAEHAVTDKDNADKETFDLSKLGDFLAVYRGIGDWMTEANKDLFIMQVPVDLKDGVYELELTYQIMDANGAKLSGNGLWGRRFADVLQSTLVWCTEYDVAGFKGMDLPSPNKELTTRLTVTVTDGSFGILCLDFNAGDILAVKSVKKISGSSERFDMNKVSSYKNVFVSTGAAIEQFEVLTNHKERGQIELEISYYAVKSDGYMLTGNGQWGRRMLDEGSEEIWLCATAPASKYPESEQTIPEPNQLVKRKVTVTLNKNGKFVLNMYDFLPGETIVIKDITYNGQSIVAK